LRAPPAKLHQETPRFPPPPICPLRPIFPHSRVMLNCVAAFDRRPVSAAGMALRLSPLGARQGQGLADF
jgi:hypothetical protein